jgi:NAD+ diphosphatase
MCGFYARADERKEVRVDLDNELVEAKWYTRKEILEILNWGKEGEGTKIEWKKISEAEKAMEEQQAKTLAQARAQAQAQAKGEGKKEGEILSVWTENKDHQDVVEEKVKEKPDEPPFRIPPTTAIAGVLIRDWAMGKVKFEPIGDEGEGFSAKISNL